MTRSCAWPALWGLLIAASPVAAATESDQRTHRHEIDSRALEERRVVDVRVPIGYDKRLRYPVLYVLDGEWSFDLVASYIDYHVREGLYPPVIVTGVRNVNRNRDYVAQPDRRFPYTGDADAFVGFVSAEWRKLIATHYTPSGQRILLGHSFGGTFVLHTLFTRPDLFDAYIALGASTWVAERFLFDEAKRYFSGPGPHKKFVYMAVGENDGGPTVPDGKALAREFEEHAPASLEWYFEIHPRTEHFLNFTTGLHDGMQRLFPHWGHDTEVIEAARSRGAQGVERWFRARREALGFRFHPAWFDLGVAALQLSREGLHEAAICVVEALSDWHGSNPNLLAMAAEVYRAAGDLDSAEATVERARAEAIAQRAAPNAIQLPRLDKLLARIREQRDGDGLSP